ncbi:hypothetical protein ABOM_002679 [Aspergillus bombycis]|uniref:Rhodopsin domain-containing protein n=1 Tax=Aspergillus bombycis TaxID=109264 RepID=A0A1F8A8K8_9EURO|nr:hypothetical protein ABOM_002679 [Aspergillus bombycis]OGM48027.1 hypothetical protein ABOM_002679 [Aspergillus bombycis]
MASLTLSSGIESPSERENQLFAILNEYAQPSSSTTASAAAQSIHGFAAPLLSDSNADSLENLLWQVWNIVINVAKQIPCDSPSQERLVELVKALTDIPPTTIQIWGNDTKLWVDLPLLGPEMREAWNLTPTGNEAEEKIKEWINLNSFVARLLSLGLAPWTNLAVWALRDALEEESSGRKVECDIAVAREWFKHGGPVLRQQTMAAENKEERIMAGGSLYQGPAKLCPERWNFWKERLSQMSDQGGELGQVASTAKTAMDHLEEYWSRLLIVLSIVGAVVATLFYLLRLYSHCLGTGKLDAGDVLLGLGLVLSYGITITTVVAALEGVGIDLATLSWRTLRRVTLEMFWIAQEFWPAVQVCIKVSIILLLRRFLGSVKSVLPLTLVLAVFTIAWGLAALVANTFQCWPPQTFWNHEIGGHCVSGQKALFMALGSVSFLEDIVLLAIPFAIVWQMQIAPRKKILLTILFCMGGMVCIFSLLRLIVFRYYPETNLTESGTKERIWTLLEIDIAVVCASVVMMPPLFKRCTETCRRTYQQTRSRWTTAEFPEQTDRWPLHKHCTNLSLDGGSEVRSQAYPPSTVDVRDRRANIAGGCIRVETTILRDVHDRDMLWPQPGRSSSTSGVPSTLAGEDKVLDDMLNVDFSGVGEHSPNRECQKLRPTSTIYWRLPAIQAERLGELELP